MRVRAKGPSVGAYGRATTFLVLVSMVFSVLATQVAMAPPAQAARVALWKKYAPLVFFHPEETYFPSSTDHFLRNSDLYFAEGIDEKRDSTPEADRLGGERDTYTRRADGVTYRSTQCTRPYAGGAGCTEGQRPDSLPNPDGFYLDLENNRDARNYIEPPDDPHNWVVNAPVYFQMRALERGGFALTYWFFYPYNKKFPLNHEGDWERISVRLDENYVALETYYSQHNGCSDPIPWAQVPRYGQHPVVYVAKGGHASYQSPGSHQICKIPGGSLPTGIDEDATSGDGMMWLTWESGFNADKEPWHGYGGAWGEPGNLPRFKHDTTGPLGPSKYKDPNPPWKEGSRLRGVPHPDPEIEVDDEPATSEDTDGDGLAGINDRCPNEAGTAAHFGCPELANVELALQQVDNNGNVRSCGSTDAQACSDIVKRFRATISTSPLPDVDLLVKAWRRVDGSWVETSQSPFMRLPITGSTVDFSFDANALPGVWRFQVQVPRDPEGTTDFAASNYQFLRIEPDTSNPTLGKPVATLSSPTSRVVNFALNAQDDSGTVSEMRVRVGPDEAEWRPWVDFAPSGTVILPDRFGVFTIWFQVRDASGNLSLERAADNVTRVQDTTAPTLGKPVLTHSDPASRTVGFSLDAADDIGPVSQMRVRVGPDEAEFRPWVEFSPTGTVILPDRYGTFTVWFQVMDAAGNVSLERAADNVTRTAPVSLNLQQIDNNGNVRSCGSSDASPCSDVVKKFRATISSAQLPDVDLLVKAWRLVDGSWVETSQSPFMRMAITGPVMEFEFTANALAGVWRFQVQVPRDPEGATDFAASNYQYLRID